MDKLNSLLKQGGQVNIDITDQATLERLINIFKTLRTQDDLVMEDKIRKYVMYNDHMYIKIQNYLSIKKIHDFYFDHDLDGHNMDIGTASDEELYFYGLYYFIRYEQNNNSSDEVLLNKYYGLACSNLNALVDMGDYCYYKKDIQGMMKYYLLAINRGHPAGMIALASYYETINKYTNILKCYLMGIKLNDAYSMYGLSLYYLHNSTNQPPAEYDPLNKPWNEYCLDSGKKYAEMAIEQGYLHAHYNIGLYFSKKGNMDNAVKHYLIASEHGSRHAMLEIGRYYQRHNMRTIANTYYKQAIELGCDEAMNALGCYYKANGEIDNMVKYFEMGINKGNMKCINDMNEYLKENQSITLLTKYRGILNTENRETLMKHIFNCFSLLDSANQENISITDMLKEIYERCVNDIQEEPQQKQKKVAKKKVVAPIPYEYNRDDDDLFWDYDDDVLEF